MAAEIFTATKQTTFKDQITGVLADGLKVGKASYGTTDVNASAMTIAAYDVSAAQSGSVYGLNVAGPVSTTALIANAITTYIAAPTKTGTGTITNSYSLKLAAPAGAATDNYSLWALGNAKIDGTSILLGTSTLGATTATVGGAYTGNTLKIAGVAANNTAVINLTTDVTTGIVNIFSGLTGTANIVKDATTINIGSIVSAPTMTLGGGTAVAATLVIGGGVTGNTIKLASANSGSISLTTDATTTAVNIFNEATGTVSIGAGSSAINMGGSAAGAFALSLGKAEQNSTLSFLSASTNKTVTIDSGVTSGLISIFATPTGSANIMTGSTGTITIGGSGSTTVIGGNLTVNGTVTTINSNTLTVDDKNIELASVASTTKVSSTTVATITTADASPTVTFGGTLTTAGLIPGMTVTITGTNAPTVAGGTTILSVDSSTQITLSANVSGTTPTAITYTFGGATDVTANGAGISVLGTTPKTLNWLSATTAWTSSENFDLATGKKYKIGTNDALSATALTLYDTTAVTPLKATITLPATLTAANQTITFPAATSTLATIALTETLQNKTLAGADVAKSRIAFSFDQGASATNALTLVWAGLAAQTINFPNAGGTLLTTETGLGLTQGTSGTVGDGTVMANTRTTFGNYTFRGKTPALTGDAFIRLTATGVVAANEVTVPIPVKSTVNANMNISAFNLTDTSYASWQITATYARGTSGNVILVGDPLVTASSTGTMSGCQVDIDPAADSIKIQVAGLAGKDIYWAAAVTTIQISHESV